MNQPPSLSSRGYCFSYRVSRQGYIPWLLLAQIYAEAAAWLENNPRYDADLAIGKATDRLSDRVASVARFAFRDAFGATMGDDGVMLLGFASALAQTRDL